MILEQLNQNENKKQNRMISNKTSEMAINDDVNGMTGGE